jgi:cytochrome c peroxidase
VTNRLSRAGVGGALVGGSAVSVLFALSCAVQPQSAPADVEVGGAGGMGSSVDTADSDELRDTAKSLVLAPHTFSPADVTNAFADDPEAAKLGQAFFFDTRFSGPLLADDNTGGPGTLGYQGDTGKVSCASCHVPEHGFVDTRSTRGQLSLASGWTHRRTPSLLDIAHTTFQTWGGRRDTAYSVVFGVIESPLEFNSSPLFVAQQIARYYREPYEAVFGSLPSFDQYPELSAEGAGCLVMPDDPVTMGCPQPGISDPELTRVVVNFGKAISAYTRLLTCGRSRFDAWMDGDESALSTDELAGAALFVGRAGCIECHSGPYLSDQKFHNVGVPGSLSPFTGVDTGGDRGAVLGLEAVEDDWLNSRGEFSDGDDERLDAIPSELAALDGAFRTPMLRCAGTRPSYFHNGEFRSLHDVVDHFVEGGSSTLGTVGTSELTPLDMSDEESEQLVAFLRALDGSGPSAELLLPPNIEVP